MKKFLLLLTVPLLMGTMAMAQSGVHLGIKGGANMNKIDGTKFKEGFDFNYHLGGYLEIAPSERIGIQPEVIFSQSTSKTASGFSDIYTDFQSDVENKNIKLNYLNIPVLVNVKLSHLLWIQLGPQYSILTSKDETLVQNGKNAFKSGDFSGVAGLWLQTPFGLSVSARYIIGLSNISDLPNQNKWKNQSIQLGVGYALF